MTESGDANGVTQRILTQLLASMERINDRMDQQEADMAAMRSRVPHHAQTPVVPVTGERSDQQGGEDLSLHRGEAEVQHGIRAEGFTLASGQMGPQYQYKSDAYKGMFRLENAKEYHVWAFTMLKFLDGEKLKELVLGSVPQPPTPASDAPMTEVRAYLYWKDSNTAAERAIMGCIGKNQIALLTRCKSAAEMWARLQRTYAYKDETNIMRLESELQEVSWKKNVGVDGYMKEIDELADQLRAVGEEVSERTLKRVLLKGLPSKYEQIKHILLQKDGASYVELCDNLRSHVGLSLLNDGPTASANATSKDKGKKNGGKGKKCSICSATGHEAKDCYSKKDPKGGKCFKCDKPGHIARFCKEARGEKKDDAEKQATMAVVSELKDDPAAHAAQKGGSWIVDSGATHHMCNERKLFTTVHDVNGSKEISLGDSSKISVDLEGNVELDFLHKNGVTECDLQGVLCVPDMARNLFSVTTCMEQGNDVHFYSSKMECHITSNGRLMGTAKLRGGLWELDCKAPSRRSKHSYVAAAGGDLKKWHLRFGHLGEDSLKRLSSKGMTIGLSLKPSENGLHCLECAAGKMTRLPFPNSERVDREVLALVHTDLIGPITPQTPNGKRFVLTFIDDRSRRTWVYLLKAKSETFECFKAWKAQAETQSEKKLKTLRSDNGGEYILGEFKDHLRDCGIIHETTVPGTPQQNGVAERFNRSLLDMARSMLHGAGIKTSFWGDAVMAANYLRNRAPTKGLRGDLTPFEAFGGRKPNVENLRAWGCKCAVHIPDAQRRKMDPKSVEGVMMGYAEAQKAWRIWIPSKQKHVVSRDVIFYEDMFPTLSGEERSEDSDPLTWSESDLRDQTVDTPQREAGSDDEHVIIVPVPHRVEVPLSEPQGALEEEEERIDPTRVDDVEHGDEDVPEVEQSLEQPPTLEDDVDDATDDVEEVPPPQESQMELPAANSELRRSTRERKQTEQFGYSNLGVPNRAATKYSSYLVEAEDVLTYSQAVKSKDEEKWRVAIQKEMDSLAENETWELVPLPHGRKAVGCKWVFKIKTTPKGEERYKARLVAKGYSQIEGIDYEETYAPVIKFQSLRILLAVANEEGMDVHQMDVTTAFLYGELQEEIFMKQAEGQVKPGQEHLVCKLKRSLYGLKQSPRCWNQKMDRFLMTNGFHATKSDSALYVKGAGKDKIYVGLYVDDLLIATSDASSLARTKSALCGAFKMTDFGEVSTVLGIKITRDKSTGLLTMSQEKYAEQVLKRFNMLSAQGKSTPIEEGMKLDETMCPQTDEEKEEMRHKPYRQAVGSLMYLMVATRPDLAAAVRLVSRFGANPGVMHWKAVQRVLQYLKKTMSFGLVFEKQGRVRITAYTDSDWSGCKDTKKSTTGYVFLIGGACVSWCSRRQKSIAMSSCEAEYIAACEATREAAWEVKLLGEMGYNRLTPITICSDSQSAMALVENPVFHEKSKHIETKYHYVRDRAAAGLVRFEYCPTLEMVADSLTKGVPKAKTEFCRSAMGVRDLATM